MKFEELVGQEFEFFGVDGNSFKLGNHVFEALEDEDDGYRSYLRSVEVKDPSGLIFFGQPVAKVKLTSVDDAYGFVGFELKDSDGHLWLRLGTDHSDDYYPMFIFQYAAKAP